MPVAKYISVIVASMLKFIGGPLAGVALGLSWAETALCTVLGMMISVVVITFAGAAIERFIDRWRKHGPRRFSRRTRLAVRIWKKSGLFGIALLTPLLLTPIGGSALAISFRVSRGRIIAFMLGSAIFWGIVLTLALYQIPWLRGLFSHR